MSCTSQTAYDLAWQQQIDKEYHAAELNRLRITDSTGFKTFASRPAKMAPHWITGFIPIEKAAIENVEQQPSVYDQGLPYRSVYTRRNNPQIFRDIKNLSAIHSPFNTRYHVDHEVPKSALQMLRQRFNSTQVQEI